MGARVVLGLIFALGFVLSCGLVALAAVTGDRALVVAFAVVAIACGVMLALVVCEWWD